VKGIDEGLLDYFIYQNKSAISKSLKKKFKAMKLIINKNKNKKYLYYLFLEFSKNIFKSILLGHK
jgi:hypothetical protein